MALPTITIHSGITVKGLGIQTLAQLRQMATVKNPKWEIAKSQYLRGVDKEIELFSEENGIITVPRGYINKVIRGFKILKQQCDTIDNRLIFHASMGVTKGPALRPYQTEAMMNLINAEQGIYQAPPGAGKTVTALETISQLNQTTLIITEKLEIARQWVARAKEHFGADLGFVGAGEFNLKEVTVALQQTLWSQKERLDKYGFWDMWGCVIVDECHHMQAITFQEIINKFPAKYRFGLSATPAKSLNTWPLIQAYLGGIVASSEKDISRNPSIHAVSPQASTNSTKSTGLVELPTEIRIVKSNFQFNYIPTYFYGRKLIRNNYKDLIDSLIEDKERNNLILNLLLKEKKESILILSRRLKQIDILYNSLKNNNIINNARVRVERLTGKESSSERKRIVELANQENIILFSSVADEGLDIARLSRLFLIFPTANVQTVKQQIGRVQRQFPGKEKCVVYDLWEDAGPLMSQYYKRYSFYLQQGFTIDMAFLQK